MPETRKPEEQDYLLRATPKAKLFKLGAVIAGFGVATIGVGLVDYIDNGGENFDTIAAGYLPLTLGVLTMAVSGVRTIHQYDKSKRA